ncbi:deaminase [Nocardioides mangrovicus]|uniref:Deaminase n=1 Tax=Nocardioides mangrovicus TaxID=2478913 RepID=A0A3L8P510_9ACTN|nr:dihydrofolate reductase family protein [Nocardioides mangrovicus]RLV50261.1 deaminase [Nocardioides mangrovicus]
MGSIAVHEFVSLDGVDEDPSWTADFGWDPAMGETLAQITGAADSILLGRRTFEMFAPAWRERTPQDDPGAEFFNDSAKFVVTSTNTSVGSQWQNSTVLGTYSAPLVEELKSHHDLYVSGSGTGAAARICDI